MSARIGRRLEMKPSRLTGKKIKELLDRGARSSKELNERIKPLFELTERQLQLQLVLK